MLLDALPKPEQMTDILDIKPIVKMSLLGVWVALFCLLLILLYVVYRALRKKEKPLPKPVVVPRTYTPRELALRELDELDALQLIDRGQFRKYYFRVSEILRLFLQDEIRLPAVDATTEEIRPHLKSSKYLTPEEVATADRLLVDMDLVKFAKFVPAPEEIRTLRQNLRNFIQTAPLRSFEKTSKSKSKSPATAPLPIPQEEGRAKE
ncbi:MAG: hypothetical protein U1F57_11905 [bacterium]